MQDINELLSRGVEKVIVKENIIKKLEAGKKLRIKFGVDPTAPDLHLGHVVVLKKLKEFQSLGAEIIFLIGDYTTKIGDPSGKNKTRPMLTDEEIDQNTKTYIDQVSKVFDTSEITIRKNSEWLDKLKWSDVLALSSKMTVNAILERDDFSKRYKNKGDIGLHELSYPFMQAYDSVVLKPDIEIGGTDQTFNFLAGRELMKKMGLEPQDIITVPLLIGTDGKEKMSKSLGNYIALNESPSQMFGKVMSIPDELIVPYYQLATDITTEGFEMVKKELAEGKNPRDLKAKLAFLIVELIYDGEKAEQARLEFDKVFKNKENPEEMEIKKIDNSEMRLDDLLIVCQMTESKSEAKRLVEQGGVEIDNEKMTDPFKSIEIKNDMIIKVGKRKFVKIQK